MPTEMAGAFQRAKDIRTNMPEPGAVSAIDLSTGAKPESLRPRDNPLPMALGIIWRGEGGFVAKNISKFSGRDHRRIADELIAAGQGEQVALFRKSFEGIGQTDLVLDLIRAGKAQFVADYPKLFDLVGTEAIVALIRSGAGASVVGQWRFSTDVDRKRVALELVAAGLGYEVVSMVNADQFSGLGQEVALCALRAGVRPEAVCTSMDPSEPLGLEMAKELIARGMSDYVLERASALPEPCRLEVATAYMKTTQDYAEAVRAFGITGSDCGSDEFLSAVGKAVGLL